MFLLTVLWTAGEPPTAMVCQKSSLVLQLSEVKFFGEVLQVPYFLNLQLDDGLGPVIDQLAALVAAAVEDEA